jgi:UDP-N-acetylmuramate--alanine ligase
LEQLFSTFRDNTKSYFIANQDYPLTKKLSQTNPYNFGTVAEAAIKGTNFKQEGFSISFEVNGVHCTIPAIGKHNMENALAAIAATKALSIPIEESTKALATFRGIYRRAQLVGKTENNCYVIDDFAHNPAEVAAVIKACQPIGNRVIAWFQPHGFGPMRFMHAELSKMVGEALREQDLFLISDIYYAGGTVDRNISSTIVSEAMQANGKNAEYVKDKEFSLKRIKELCQPNDVIIIMGARDPHLDEFAKEVLNSISKK